MRAGHEAVEQVSDILSRVCPGGVSVETPFETTDEGLGARPDTTRPAIVRGYVSGLDRADARRAVEAARRALGHLQAFGLGDIGELQTRLVNEEDWADAWKEHFPVLRVGQRIVIQPTWREHAARPDEVVIRLDPGMAFGTGLHPTTRLCLVALEEAAADGMLADADVLDVGSGSGILAIACGFLGARHIAAVDVDPLAVETTRRNASLNGLADRIEAAQGSLPLADERRFDLVVANLVAGLLVDLAPALAAVVKPGGRLIVGGIFHDREPDVASSLSSAGLTVRRRWTETDWVALEAVPTA